MRRGLALLPLGLLLLAVAEFAVFVAVVHAIGAFWALMIIIGASIAGLPKPGEDYRVFHAGTALEDGRVVVNGGRVLCVTAMGHNVRTAQKRAYEIVSRIRSMNPQLRDPYQVLHEGQWIRVPELAQER